MKLDKVVYTHSHPNTGEVFYVGSGGKKRAYATYKSVRSPEWIEYVQEHDIKPIVNIVHEGLTIRESKKLEKQLILEIGIENLVNVNYGDNHGPETKKKISDSIKGRIYSDEHRMNISKNHARYWKGKEKPEEAIKKISKALKDIPKSEDHKNSIRESLKPYMRPVFQLNEFGNVLNTFDSVKEASKITGVNQGNISQCCNGRRLTAGGYIWIFQ